MDVTTPVTSMHTHTHTHNTHTHALARTEQKRLFFFSFMTVGHGFLSELFMNALFLYFLDKFTYLRFVENYILFIQSRL